MFRFSERGKRDDLGINIEIVSRRNRIDFEFVLVLRVLSLVGRRKKFASVIEEIVGMEVNFLVLDLLPDGIERGMILFKFVNDIFLVFKGKTGDGVKEGMEIAGDKIDGGFIERVVVGFG